MFDYDEHLCITIEGTELSKNLSECLQCHIKESTATAYSWTLTEQNLKSIHAYQLAKCKWDSLSGTVAAKSEVVTAGMMCAKKHKQEKDEVIKAQCVVKIAECCLQSEQDKADWAWLSSKSNCFVS